MRSIVLACGWIDRPRERPGLNLAARDDLRFRDTHVLNDSSNRMKLIRCFSRMGGILAAAGVVLFGVGCANIFVPKYKVLVDSITAPNTSKPTGQSYRLIAKSSIVTSVPVQVSVVKACIDAALSGIGMYEPPPSVAPDLFIEVSYGNSTAGARVDPTARETFLQLSARSNPERSNERATGPEVWDVRVGVLGIAGRMESAMPLLSAVAANYIATDTQMETKVEIPQNEPSVRAVRETAIQALEARGPAAGSQGARPAGTEGAGQSAGVAPLSNPPPTAAAKSGSAAAGNSGNNGAPGATP